MGTAQLERRRRGFASVARPKNELRTHNLKVEGGIIMKHKWLIMSCAGGALALGLAAATAEAAPAINGLSELKGSAQSLNTVERVWWRHRHHHRFFFFRHHHHHRHHFRHHRHWRW